MGFPDAANSIPALGAAMFIPFVNQNLCNQDIQAPAASFIEMEVVHWLRQQLGFKVAAEYTTVTEIGGVMTSGGCLSNTVGMMAARESLFPGSGMTGLPVVASKIRVLVPDVIEHYSIRSAMAWLGMGEANVVRVPVDELYRMKTQELERVIKEEIAAGHHLLACVPYAGDSRSMRIDNLQDIGVVLRKHKVWFHVDACHGSQLAFSRTHRHKIAGIEEADSVWSPFISGLSGVEYLGATGYCKLHVSWPIRHCNKRNQYSEKYADYVFLNRSQSTRTKSFGFRTCARSLYSRIPSLSQTSRPTLILS